eukprot:2251118-Karenia_brevis.AAC.1
MWWDALCRSKRTATEVNQILSSVPVPIMAAGRLHQLTADYLYTMDDSGFGTITILEITFV